MIYKAWIGTKLVACLQITDDDVSRQVGINLLSAAASAELAKGVYRAPCSSGSAVTRFATHVRSQPGTVDQPIAFMVKCEDG